MTWLAGIGIWFAVQIPLGVLLGKTIKRGQATPDELWSIHHGGGMQ
jgi:hypothetical protein